jgi:hypothetical protein
VLCDADSVALCDADWVVLCDADSVALCDADSVVDSVAESLVAPVLPGVRTVLPSVARVFTCAAVTSYEMGVMSDMIYSPRSPRTVTDRIG